MKKVEKGHKVVPDGAESNPAEDLISEQSDASAEYELGEDESEKTEEPAKEVREDTPKQPAPEEPKKAVGGSCNVMLTGAASYTGCGMRFYKGKSEEVSEKVCKKLLSTKLFTRV